MTEPTPQRPVWLDDFTIPADAAGAVVAVDFGDDGLWAARMGADGRVEQVAVEPRITPSVLDIRVASYLHHGEAVPGTDDPQVFAELLDLCRRARTVLIERDSVILMGTEHLRLVTITLDTAMAATVPEVNRANGLIVELAGREPVAAVFLGPGMDLWPGLWETLTDRGFALLGPDDPFPETFVGDDEATRALEALPETPTSLAWATAPAEALPDAAAAAEFAERAPSAAAARRTRALLTAAALAVIALGGIGLAAATMTGDDDSPPAAAESGATAVSTPEQGGDEAPIAASPSELRAARAPMKRYVPPKPTSSSTTKTSEAPLGPQPRPRPRPDNRRTIPNPIPGLPPIIIG
ncbi:hypothetical protein MUG78_07555 [Gordonia alkaliphila]|uniref:Uncharacterized protein n=1 Tax=Gordonia alkaliphila TaxID=1053547 RepID=A0ABP8ZFS6_9ACTN|nr:hypothetical protein [Gordonia alkaliphila]MCK0439318.1 hypothetical protein [Gordonia alkaliphila]